MHYSTLLMVLYPGISKRDYKLQDDGDGAYIKEWYYTEPAPNESLQVLYAQHQSEVEAKQAEIEASLNQELSMSQVLEQLTILKNRVEDLMA